MELIENKKIRKFVFKCLNDLLSDKTVYPYDKNFWIIGLEERNWYIHYDSNGKLYYNSKYFDDFFHMFSLEQKKYQILLRMWFVKSTKFTVNQISRRSLDIDFYIDGIVNGGDNKMWSMSKRYGFSYFVVKKFLELKQGSNSDVKFNNFLNEIEVY